jgi:hypothetical protein
LYGQLKNDTKLGADVQSSTRLTGSPTVHYGLTAEELDFILNYDIKYRLGCDTETEEE